MFICNCIYYGWFITSEIKSNTMFFFMYKNIDSTPSSLAICIQSQKCILNFFRLLLYIINESIKRKKKCFVFRYMSFTYISMYRLIEIIYICDNHFWGIFNFHFFLKFQFITQFRENICVLKLIENLNSLLRGFLLINIYIHIKIQ